MTVKNAYTYQMYRLNIYAVQQDTRSVSMSKFYSALVLARHVSDLTGPSSGALANTSAE